MGDSFGVGLNYSTTENRLQGKRAQYSKFFTRLKYRKNKGGTKEGQKRDRRRAEE